MVSLHEWRRRRLLSVRELAERAGVNKQTIINIEHGRHRAPHPSTMRKLVEALGVERDDVTEFAFDRPPRPTAEEP